MASPSAFQQQPLPPSSPASPLDDSQNDNLSPGRKRKRGAAPSDGGGEGVTHESAASPTHERRISHEFNGRTGRRTALSKRACNECRQQKVSLH